MRLINITPCLAWVALSVATTYLVATANAATEGYKLAEKTGASIADFLDEIVNVKKEVDTTMGALGKIVADAAINPRDAFKDFDKGVPKVESAAQKAKKRSEDIKTKGQKYFDQWEKELASVNNPDVRKLAEERKVKLQAVFSNIKTVMEPTRDQFNVWLADLKDLQKYLSNDLTIGGIDAAKELISKTNTEGQALQQSMDKVIAELNTVVATITPAKAKKK